MKVLRLHATGDLRLHDENEPLPDRDECLLRVKAVGLCGSDVHWYEEAGIGDAQLRQPLVLGHEFAGIIESGNQQGQHVAVDPADACRQCRYCEEGNPNLCDNMRFAGHGVVDGALREKLCWPQALVYPLPDETHLPACHSDGAKRHCGRQVAGNPSFSTIRIQSAFETAKKRDGLKVVIEP